MPPVRIQRAGVLNAELFATILQNVREPDMFKATSSASLPRWKWAPARCGPSRALWVPMLLAIGDALLDHAEAAMRQAIRALPDGTYAAEIWSMADGIDSDGKRIAVALTIAG